MESAQVIESAGISRDFSHLDTRHRRAPERNTRVTRSTTHRVYLSVASGFSRTSNNAQRRASDIRATRSIRAEVCGVWIDAARERLEARLAVVMCGIVWRVERSRQRESLG